MNWLQKEFPGETVFCVAQGPHYAALEGCGKVLSFDAGIGQSNALNHILRAYSQTQDDWLLILDNDIIGTKIDALRPVVRSLNAKPDWDAVSLVQHNFPSPTSSINFYSTYFLCSAAQLIRPSCIGVEFDADRKYMKDVDWGVRAQMQGLRTYRMQKRRDIVRNAGANDSTLFSSNSERWRIYNRELARLSEKTGHQLTPHGTLREDPPLKIDLTTIE